MELPLSMGTYLPDPVQTVANWLAMAAFGRERARLDDPSFVVKDGVRLSQRSVALLYSDPAWLQALVSPHG